MICGVLFCMAYGFLTWAFIYGASDRRSPNYKGE